MPREMHYFDPTADTFVSSTAAEADTVYGQYFRVLIVQNRGIFKGEGFTVAWAIVRFGIVNFWSSFLAAHPGATIEKAYLVGEYVWWDLLHGPSIPGGTDATLEVWSPALIGGNVWDEATLTWNILNAGPPFIVLPGVTFPKFPIPIPFTRWCHTDITDLVQKSVADAKDYGVLIKFGDTYVPPGYDAAGLHDTILINSKDMDLNQDMGGHGGVFAYRAGVHWGCAYNNLGTCLSIFGRTGEYMKPFQAIDFYDPPSLATPWASTNRHFMALTVSY